MAGSVSEAEATGGRSMTAYSVAVIVAFAVQPFAAFYQANRSQIPHPARLAIYALAVALVGVGIWAGISAVRGWRRREAVALSLVAVLASFFNASLWLSPEARGSTVPVQLVLWLVATAAAAVLFYRLAVFPGFRVAVLVFAAVFLVVPVVGIAIPASSDARSGDDPQLPALAGDVDGSLPNVYWFVTDSYGREDQLEAVIDLDISDFSDALRERGFDVSTSSMGSYAHTHLSLSSTLDMTYRVEPGNDVDEPFETLGPVVRGDNEVVRRFEDLGYQYVYSPQGWLPWSACDADYVDLCLPPRGATLGTGEVELSLLDLTPLGPIDLLGLPYTDPVWVMDQLDAKADDLQPPFFLFAHVNTPHWPYRYDEQCEARRRPLDAQKLSLEERMTGYGQDITCLNPLLLDAFDRIVQEDPDAIIVVQSDHGSDFYSDWNAGPDAWDSGALTEKFGVLNAIRMPSACGDLPVEGAPLVNTFRLVFSCIEGRDHDLLDWRAFISPLHEVTQLEELDPERFEPGSPTPDDE